MRFVLEVVNIIRNWVTGKLSDEFQSHPLTHDLYTKSTSLLLVYSHFTIISE
jgi:hypothetical protein